MSADSEHCPDQPAPDQVPDWEMADLPVPGEPGCYPDPVPGEPGWYPDDTYDDGSDQRAAFADGGWADALAPDPVLATLVDLVQRDGLARLDDDQLTGVLQASPSPGPPASPGRPIPGPPASPGRPIPRPPATPATPVPDWLRGLAFTTLQTGTCTHPRESRGYQPSPALRHLIQIRNPACTSPGCRHPPPAATWTT